MKIAEVVSSNSHIDYIARVIDAVDGEKAAPDASDYGFGQFVALERSDESVIGVIYDSRLVNPEYGSFGPRSGPRAELARHNADHVREQGILIGILLLGTVDGEGNAVQGIPRKVVPVGQPVKKLDQGQVRRFHADGAGGLQLHYYPHVVANARQFAIPLLDSIIGQLSVDCSETDAQRLQVLKRSLHWQGTFAGMKL